MSDAIWTRDEPDSPCVQTCVMHTASGLCIGCLRTLDEIATWSSLTRSERLSIMAGLDARKSKIEPKRRGERKGRLR